MISMLTLTKGTIDSSTVLRSVTALQSAIGAELLVVCPELGPPFTAAEVAEAQRQARRAFDVACGAMPGCRFKTAIGAVTDMLRKQAMFADLCVIPRRSGLAGDDLGLLRAALVDGGIATVLMPPEPAAVAPGTVVLSWNGQAASARAIKAAMPFARRSERVVVLEHAGNEVNRSRLTHYLDGQGVAPGDWRVYGDAALTARGRARALLAAVKAEGGDLLAMGAYGDRGERLFRFGRATEKIAEAARIPVLFSC